MRAQCCYIKAYAHVIFSCRCRLAADYADADGYYAIETVALFFTAYALPFAMLRCHDASCHDAAVACRHYYVVLCHATCFFADAIDAVAAIHADICHVLLRHAAADAIFYMLRYAMPRLVMRDAAAYAAATFYMIFA